MHTMTIDERHTLLAAIAKLLTTRGPWRLELTTKPGFNDKPQVNAAIIADPTTDAAQGEAVVQMLLRKKVNRPSLWFGENKGKLEVHGNWPQYADGQFGWPKGERGSIGISLKKSPTQIAAEIERRFFPVYLPLWDEMLEGVNQTDSYQDKRKANLARVAKETGAELYRRSPNDEGLLHYGSRSLSNGYTTKEQVSSDSMQFEVRSVPIDLGIKIINLVNRYNGGQ